MPGATRSKVRRRLGHIVSCSSGPCTTHAQYFTIDYRHPKDFDCVVEPRWAGATDLIKSTTGETLRVSKRDVYALTDSRPIVSARARQYACDLFNLPFSTQTLIPLHYPWPARPSISHRRQIYARRNSPIPIREELLTSNSSSPPAPPPAAHHLHTLQGTSFLRHRFESSIARRRLQVIGRGEPISTSRAC